MIKKMYWLLLLWPCSLSLLAADANSLVQIEQICLHSPNECLEKLPSLLASASPNSRVRFKLLLLEFDAMFVLERSDALLQAMTPWLERSDIPDYFKLNLYIYYAKEISHRGETERGLQYLNKAKALLYQVNESFPDPMRLIKVINLQLYFEDEIASAYQNLLLLERKFFRLADPQFKMELYANLGHLALRLGLLEQQVSYREQSLEWSIKYGNKQQMGVAASNLARALDMVDRHFEAALQYKQAITYADQAKDTMVASLARLYLAKIKLEQKQCGKAQSLLDGVVASLLQNERLALYQKLRQQLAQC